MSSALSLLDLPLDILESIAMMTAEQDVRAAVGITVVCRRLRSALEDAGGGNAFWKKVCQKLGVSADWIPSKSGSFS